MAFRSGGIGGRADVIDAFKENQPLRAALIEHIAVKAGAGRGTDPANESAEI